MMKSGSGFILMMLGAVVATNSAATGSESPRLFGRISCLSSQATCACGDDGCSEEGCCAAGDANSLCGDIDLCATYCDVYGQERQFPLLASLALDRGYQIPLPFGAQATSNTMWTEPVIEELRLGFLGNDPTIVPGFTLQNLKNRNQTVIGRVDGWIFPFLNLYGFAGHTWVQSDADLVVPSPIPMAPDLSLRIPIRLDGPTYGGGFTLAAGYQNWFIAFDVNEANTELGFDSEIRKRTGTVRSGFRGDVLKGKASIWAGAMYLERRARLNGTLAPGTGLDPIRFSLVQEFDDPWSYLIGTTWEPNPTWTFLVEGGLGAIRQVTAGIQVRI